MYKFAMFDYVKNKNEIPTKFNILKKAPDFIWEWYVKKFNPLSVHKIDLDFADGFLIKLPIEKSMADKKLFSDLLSRTLITFPQIKIISVPDNFLADNFLDKIKISYGNFMFSFLAIQAIKKFLPAIEKKIDRLEIFIIDANPLFTQILIDNIYPHINYLTVITNQKKSYTQKEQDIFADTGLNLQFLNYRKSVVKNADVIINTGIEDNFDYAIKRNTLYFYLGNSKQNFCQLKIKRPDIFAFDSLNLYCMDKPIDNILLEIAIYCMCDDFKKICDGSYSQKLFSNVSAKLKALNVKISSFQK